eukprot:Hpha_TRINITY_DN16118_c1_g26::TRINITY_DN16118_c1_g26_i1::g.8272::m.8272/K09516/RETSAT; all-trans-retinol 13,14-reductase
MKIHEHLAEYLNVGELLEWAKEHKVATAACACLALVPVYRILTGRGRHAVPRGDLARRKFRKERIPPEGTIDTIVIGSGMGGMACASLLAQSGQRVLVLEQHDRLGGCTHTFIRTHEDETGSTSRPVTCEFDTGTHYVALAMVYPWTRSGALMGAVTQGKVKWNDLGNPWDKVLFPDNAETDGVDFPNNNTYEFVKTEDRLVPSIVNALVRPEQPAYALVAERIIAFLAFCNATQKATVFMFLARMLPRWFEKRYLSSWTAPFHRYGALTTGKVLNMIIGNGRSAQEVLEGCDDPKAETMACTPEELTNTLTRAKGVMVHPIGDYACQPNQSSIMAHALTAFYYMDGAAYTEGPTQDISRAAARPVLERGGDCLTNARVERIVLNDTGRAVGVTVRPADKPDAEPMTLHAKNIVHAAGVYHLYREMLPQTLPVVQRFQNFASRPSTGHVYLFVTLKGTPEELGLPTTNLWYLNGYKTDEAFDTYFAAPETTRPPTVYIGFPCVKDPKWKTRYPKISNCILISDGSWDWFAKFADTEPENRGEEYDALKSKLSDTLLNILYEKVPCVKGKVMWAECGTPVSDANHLGSYQGGSYGTRCTPTYFSQDAREWLMRGDTEVPGLYLAGEDAWCPAVAGACYGGLLGASKVLGVAGTLSIGMRMCRSAAQELREFCKARGYRLGTFASYWWTIALFFNRKGIPDVMAMLGKAGTSTSRPEPARPTRTRTPNIVPAP